MHSGTHSQPKPFAAESIQHNIQLHTVLNLVNYLRYPIGDGDEKEKKGLNDHLGPLNEGPFPGIARYDYRSKKGRERK